MRFYKYWYIYLLIIVFFLGISLYLYVPRNISVSEMFMESSAPCKAQAVVRDGQQTPYQLRQMALLKMPWGRDLFGVKPVQTSVKPVTQTSATPVIHASATSVMQTSPKKELSIQRPIINQEGGLDALTLTGIVFFDNHYMAIINDKGYKEGEKVNEFEVVNIKRLSIVLADQHGQHHALQLK